MPAPSSEAVEKARKRVEQAKARLEALNTRVANEGRRLDTRRKIILGGLLIDAAMKDPRYRQALDDLVGRITRDQDHKAFANWTLPA